MSERRKMCRCPMCSSRRWLRDPIDRWQEDWDRAARDFDPGFESRKRQRQADQIQRSNEIIRRLVDEAERARREDDPTVN